MAEEFTEEDVAVVAKALWAGIREDFPRAGPIPTPTCYADGRTVLRALVAAGWRRVPTDKVNRGGDA